MNTLYKYEPETIKAAAKIPAGTVNAQSHRIGMEQGEPLIVIADALLKYAKAYAQRFDGPVFNDGVGGDAFKDMLKGVKTFLDFDGGIALAKGITTDTKDNGAVMDIIEATCKFAGIDYQDL